MDARTQVLQDISALETQVSLFTAEVDVITNTDPLDQAKYAAIKSELETAQGKLDNKRAELATIDEAGIAAQAELSEALDNIDIGGETVSLRALAADEASYQLIYIAIQEKFTVQAQSHAQVVAALKSSYESQIEELEYSMSEISTLRQENYRLSDERADLEAKRDAAADQIQEQQDEITRLKSDNDNLRKQLEDSAKPKETTEDAKAALERWKNSRPAITDLRWKDESRKTTYVATLVETGEPIEFGYLEINRYRQVTEDEANRFRAEQAEQDSQNAVSDLPLGDSSVLEPPVIEFPSVPVQTESTAGTVVLSPEEVTRRLLALEKRVDQIVGVESDGGVGFGKYSLRA